MTLSEIAADPRAKKGQEFTCGDGIHRFAFDKNGISSVYMESLYGWANARFNIQGLTRTDWHFIEPAGVDS